MGYFAGCVIGAIFGSAIIAGECAIGSAIRRAFEKHDIDKMVEEIRRRQREIMARHKDDKR